LSLVRFGEILAVVRTLCVPGSLKGEIRARDYRKHKEHVRHGTHCAGNTGSDD
jgi:hypothetical protein